MNDWRKDFVRLDAVKGWLFDVYPVSSDEVAVWVIAENGQRIRFVDKYVQKIYACADYSTLNRLAEKIKSNSAVAAYRFVEKQADFMKATPETVTVALDLYFKGISMRAIVDHLKQFYDVEVSHVAIYKWIRKYVKMLKTYADQLVPRVSGIWHSDEMTLNIRDLDNHENLRWAWNVIDNSSRFWLATQITEKREIADARKVLAQASSLSKTRPMAVVTDGLRAYQDAIPKEFYTMKMPRTQHVRIPNSRDRSNNNMVERLHGTIRQRSKVMRGLDDMETAQTMMDGLRIYYNFIRPHMALDGKTPTQQAKIDVDSSQNWLALIRKATKANR